MPPKKSTEPKALAANQRTLHAFFQPSSSPSASTPPPGASNNGNNRTLARSTTGSSRNSSNASLTPRASSSSASPSQLNQPKSSLRKSSSVASVSNSATKNMGNASGSQASTSGQQPPPKVTTPSTPTTRTSSQASLASASTTKAPVKALGASASQSSVKSVQSRASQSAPSSSAPAKPKSSSSDSDDFDEEIIRPKSSAQKRIVISDDSDEDSMVVVRAKSISRPPKTPSKSGSTSSRQSTPVRAPPSSSQAGRNLPSASASVDIKGKGKAVERSPSPRSATPSIDDDDIVEDSQDVVFESLVPPTRRTAPAARPPPAVITASASSTPRRRAKGSIPPVNFYSPSPTKSTPRAAARSSASKATVVARSSPSSRATLDNDNNVTSPSRSLRSHSRAATSVSGSPSKLTASALATLSTPRRAGNYQPSFDRSPTGSDLSSIAATPQKARTKPKIIPHSFTLEIEVKRRPPMKGVTRRERSVTRFDLDKHEDDMEVDGDSEELEAGKGDGDEDEDEEGNLSNSDSDSDDSDDGVAEALARAAARRAAGSALAPSSSTGGAIASSSVGFTSPEVRRSERAPKPTVRLSLGEGAKKKDSMGLLDGVREQGRFSMTALSRERAERERAGRDEKWKEGKELLATDFDYDSDGSESSAPVRSSVAADGLTHARVDALASLAASAVAADADDVHGEFVGSPEKRAARENLQGFAAVAKEELTRQQAEAELKGEDPERRCWREGVLVTEWVAQQGAGDWSDRIEKAIVGGKKDDKTFPAPVALFSRLRGQGTADERQAIAKRLLQLVGHPLTSPDLASSALALLSRLLAHRSSAPLLVATDFCDALESLGAKKMVFKLLAGAADPVDMDVDDADRESTPTPETRDVSTTERNTSVVRIMLALQDAVKINTLPPADILLLVVVCVRLCLDSHAAPLRNSFETTLSILLNTVKVEDAGQRCDLFAELYHSFKSCSMPLKTEMLRAIPHQFKGSKILRQWLAWAFLAGEAAVNAVIRTPAAFSEQPTIACLIALLDTTDTASPFFIHPKKDDLELYHQTVLLQLTFAQLADALYAPGQAALEGRKQVEEAYNALITADGRMRTDVRNGNPLRTKAKTVLIRLAHSLQYQLRAAQGKTSGFNFVDEEKDAKEKTEGKVARKKAKTATATTATTTTTNGEAQTTLNFGQGGAMVLQK